MVCNGISEPIAVHYLYTYAGSISSAFNQATVIGLALFKICSLLLSTYGFVDGETLMDVNEESCPWRNIHKCRSKFITTAQCNDYYYGPWSIGIAAACLLGWTASLLFCHAMIPVLSWRSFLLLVCRMCASGLMEKFLDWIVTEKSFAGALAILQTKGQVKRDSVRRPGVIEHIPKKYKEHLESKGEKVPERYSQGTRKFVLGAGSCVLCDCSMQCLYVFVLVLYASQCVCVSGFLPSSSYTSRGVWCFCADSARLLELQRPQRHGDVDHIRHRRGFWAGRVHAWICLAGMGGLEVGTCVRALHAQLKTSLLVIQAWRKWQTNDVLCDLHLLHQTALDW